MLVVVIVLVVIVVLAVAWAVAVNNGFVRLKNEVDQSFSGIDVQLQRRADLIPNLVNTVKGYAAHESSVFQAVTDARSRTLGATSVAEKAQAAGEMTTALNGLFAVAEAYPELKANENFLQLQGELSDTEDKIAAARRYYNSVVQRFNTRIEVFPARLIAGGRYQPREFFQIEELDRAAGPPQVSF
jgi:LemA protein